MKTVDTHIKNAAKRSFHCAEKRLFREDDRLEHVDSRRVFDSHANLDGVGKTVDLNALYDIQMKTSTHLGALDTSQILALRSDGESTKRSGEIVDGGGESEIVERVFRGASDLHQLVHVDVDSDAQCDHSHASSSQSSRRSCRVVARVAVSDDNGDLLNVGNVESSARRAIREQLKTALERFAGLGGA